MKLTRDQRNRLFRGGRPKIAYPGDKPCPVAAGDVHNLSRGLAIEVVKINRSKVGEWVLEYLIRDKRPKLIRRVPPIHVDRFEGQASTQAELEMAAHDSAYTHSPHAAVAECGEAIESSLQDRFTKEAHLRDAERQEADEALRRQERAVRSQLREALRGLNPQAQAILLAKVKRTLEAEMETEMAA